MAEIAAARRRVLGTLASDLVRLAGTGILRVGIDGVDGAGKTVFADELADELRRHGTAVLRASVDGFHHPREVRYRRGRHSPEGFFLDSYDYDALLRLLLDPLAPSGNRRVVTAIHDVEGERPVPHEVVEVPEPAVAIVDGIFLHRDELRSVWDHSVFLDVPFEVSVARGAARDGGDPDPDAEVNRRYVDGQRRYLEACQPRERATVVIANDPFDRPRIVARAAGRDASSHASQAPAADA